MRPYLRSRAARSPGRERAAARASAGWEAAAPALAGGARAGALRAALAALLSTVGCASSAASPGPARPLQDGDLRGWGNGAPAGARPEPPSEGPVPIELAGGERFRSLVASTIYRAPSAWAGPPGEAPQGTPDRPHCSVYVLRADSDGLEEARTSGPCGGTSDDGAEAPALPREGAFVRVEPARARHLRAVLSGAGPQANARRTERTREEGPDEGAQTTVRVATDRRTIEGAVGPVRWPDPGGEVVEPARERAPAGLAELWEAVLYPERYRPAPGAASSSTAAAGSRPDPG